MWLQGWPAMRSQHRQMLRSPAWRRWQTLQPDPQVDLPVNLTFQIPKPYTCKGFLT